MKVTIHGSFGKERKIVTEDEDEIPRVPKELITASRTDLIVMIGLSPLVGDGDVRMFPAKIDTGFCGWLHISLNHLTRWTGWDFASHTLEQVGVTTYRMANAEEETYPCYAGSLWFEECNPHNGDPCNRSTPLRDGFSVDSRIAYESGDNIPRMPLLGREALADLRATLTIRFGQSVSDSLFRATLD